MATRRLPLAVHLVLATIVFQILYLLEVLLHEVTHVLIDFAVSGQVGSCGRFGPIAIQQGRPIACLTGVDLTALNALLTPVAMSALGILAMWLSNRLDPQYLRWGVFATGFVVWIQEALYSAGWLTPPAFTPAGIEYWGDGRTALEAFGWPAQLPAATLLIIGIYVVQQRLDYTEPIPWQVES